MGAGYVFRTGTEAGEEATSGTTCSGGERESSCIFKMAGTHESDLGAIGPPGKGCYMWKKSMMLADVGLKKRGNSSRSTTSTGRKLGPGGDVVRVRGGEPCVRVGPR